MFLTTVRGRLLVAFSAITLAFGAALLGATWSLRGVGHELHQTATGRLGRLMAVERLQSETLAQAIVVRDLAINEDLKVQKVLQADIKSLRESRDAIVKSLRESMAGSPDEAARFEKAFTTSATQDKLIAEMLQLIDEARFDDVRPFVLEKLRPVQAALDDEIRRLVSESADQTAASASATEKRIGSTTGILLAVLAVVGIASVVTAFLVARSITRLLGAEPRELAAVAQRFAQGDFAQRSVAPPHSVLGQLDQAREALAGLARSIAGCATSIADISRELSDSNTNLSQRTEEQASSLEQTAASMEQITQTLRASGDSARSANERTTQASAVAREGGNVVVEVVATMREIQASSRKIAEIITVIDGIAFQTNILALNAAVEAARAGEQGRGFAVVASEVRALAQRCAQAAQQIKGLISTAVATIDTGAGRAQSAGATISDIVTQVSDVAGLVAGIANSTEEQFNGIAQVNEAITQLDRMTQQNAALVEESSATAETLASQARQLTASVSQFRT